MNSEWIRLRRELDKLKAKVDEQDKRITELETKRTLSLKKKDGEANR